MALQIRIEDFEGEILAEFNDKKGTLNYIVDYCYKNPTEFKVIKYVDLYDDTTLNSIQVKDLLQDIEQLLRSSHFFDKERVEVLEALRDLCVNSLKEPHLYLKFYGD